MKTVSVLTSATPERVWAVYRTLRWQDWDHDIASMCAAPTSPAAGLVEGSAVLITMQKDSKVHTATISDVVENECFTYSAPLPGSKMVAVHKLERVADGTRITHSFDFGGFLGGLFRMATKEYVQNGLDTNTRMLKDLAEAEEKE